MKLERRKPRHLLLTLVYRLSRLLFFLPARVRLRLYADAEWVFDRLSLEESFNVLGPDEHPFRRSALAFLQRRITTSDKVLDLGSNRGDLSALLARRCREVVGVELVEEFVQEAVRRHQAPNLQFLRADGREYVAREGAGFDVILLSHVIEHLDDPGALLEAGSRSDAKIYVEVPDFERTLLNQYRLTAGSRLIYSDADHVWEFDRDELRALLRESGLEILDEEFRHGVMRIWCRRLGYDGSQQ